MNAHRNVTDTSAYAYRPTRHVWHECAMMGAIVEAAAAILGRAGWPKALHPLLAARAAGLSLRPTEGLAVPAKLEGTALYFDEDYENWREVVGTIACGFALRKAGLPDSPENRRLMARALRTLVTNDGCVEEPGRDSVMLH